MTSSKKDHRRNVQPRGESCGETTTQGREVGQTENRAVGGVKTRRKYKGIVVYHGTIRTDRDLETQRARFV